MRMTNATLALCVGVTTASSCWQAPQEDEICDPSMEIAFDTLGDLHGDWSVLSGNGDNLYFDEGDRLRFIYSDEVERPSNIESAQYEFDTFGCAPLAYPLVLEQRNVLGGTGNQGGGRAKELEKVKIEDGVLELDYKIFDVGEENARRVRFTLQRINSGLLRMTSVWDDNEPIIVDYMPVSLGE